MESGKPDPGISGFLGDGGTGGVGSERGTGADREKSGIIIVAAGDAKIDNKLFKSKFGVKAKMLPRDETKSATGYQAGSVCPFALPDGVSVYLDESLRRFETIYPAAGSANSAAELSCPELEQCACHFSGWADVCKNWRELI